MMTSLIRYFKRAPKVVVILGVLAHMVSATASGYQDEDCISCHGGDSDTSRLTINMADFETSIHASRFSCNDCHKGVTSDYHISKAGSGAVSCADCHQIRKQHGGKDAQGVRPSCQQCHTRHRIYGRSNPASSLHTNNIVQTCSQCHREESGNTSYLSWLPSLRIESHNKQNLGVDYSEDNCLGCHQGQAAHGEVHAIVEEDCSRCHMTPEGENALLGTMHPKADVDKQPGVYAAAIFYQMLIVLVVIFGFRRVIRLIQKNSR